VGIESELNIDFGNNPNGLAAQQRGAVDAVLDGLSGCFDQQWMSANQTQPLDAPIFAYDDLEANCALNLASKRFGWVLWIDFVEKVRFRH
jgi:hypothetical protein